MNNGSIDSHVHLWKYDKREYPWISDNTSHLKRDFYLKELKEKTRGLPIDKYVLIQARQSEAENDFLQSIAESDDSVVGFIGWTDLKSDRLRSEMKQYKKFNKLMGFRHFMQDEKDTESILNKKFNDGVDIVLENGYAYEILIKQTQLENTLVFVKQHTKGRLILDHCGKPNLKKRTDSMDDKWKNSIQRLSDRKNIYCKISGLVTEGDWDAVNKDLIAKHIDFVVKYFGEDRILWGSDWPVSSLVMEYKDLYQLCTEILGKTKMEKFTGENIFKAYRLSK